MALIYMDGFNHYDGEVTDLPISQLISSPGTHLPNAMHDRMAASLQAAGWTVNRSHVNNIVQVICTQGRGGLGKAIVIRDATTNNTYFMNIFRSLPENWVDQVTVGFAYFPTSANSNFNGDPVFRIGDGAMGQVGFYFYGSANSSNVRLDTRPGTFGNSTYTGGESKVYANAVLMNTWNYVEVQLDLVSGKARLWCNNRLVLECSLSDMPNGVRRTDANALRYVFGTATSSGGNTTVFAIDDLYVVDGSGTTNNVRLGNCQIITRRPERDVQADFMRDKGDSNASQVDDVISDGDESFVYASEQGSTDLYANDEAVPDYPVHAVQVSVNARRTGGDSRGIAPFIQSGTSTRVGNNVRLHLLEYQTGATVFEVDPQTEARWTKEGVEAMHFGMMLTE